MNRRSPVGVLASTRVADIVHTYETCSKAAWLANRAIEMNEKSSDARQDPYKATKGVVGVDKSEIARSQER